MPKIIGIDLGTTNSEAAYMEGGTPKIIPSAEGSTYGGKMFPSVIAFTKDGQILVGEPAKRQAVLNPERTVMQIKRKMGTAHRVTIENKAYPPQELSAMVLRKIKTDAEAFLGEPMKQVVITVPAYFNDNQRQATRDSGRIAGLEGLRLANAPPGAAPARRLGGMDMGANLINWLVSEFRQEHGVDLSKDRQAQQRIRDAAEKAKIELSSTLETTINLPFIAQKGDKPLHLEKRFTRAKLEELIEPVLSRLEGPIKQAFKDAGWNSSDVNHIILVGGPTRMPVVRERFEKILGRGG